MYLIENLLLKHLPDYLFLSNFMLQIYPVFYYNKNTLLWCLSVNLLTLLTHSFS